MARILMYSGGLDSHILRNLYDFKKTECLFVNVGTKDAQREWDSIVEKIGRVNYVDFQEMKVWELENKILPFRNHMLALIGAQFANEIYFGFTAGDTTKDKDWVFKAQMEGILNYFGSDREKIGIELSPNERYEICMPLKGKTKTEIIHDYLKYWQELGFDISYGAELLLSSTRSCYEGGTLQCGKCRTCVRNYVALSLNDVTDELLQRYYRDDPKKYLQMGLDYARIKGRGQEIEEFEQCMKQKGI